jgi:hypothetical protein
MFSKAARAGPHWHEAGVLTMKSRSVGVGFDPSYPAAVALVRCRPLRFALDLTETQRAAIVEILATALERGFGTREAAREVRGHIVLSRAQQRELSEYRTMLTTGDATALTVPLRDRRFDKSVAKAVAGEKPLSAAQVEKIAGRFADVMLSDRAEFLAAAAFQAATSEAAHTELRNSVLSLGVAVDRVRRVWMGSLCDVHKSMDGQEVGLNEKFTGPKGLKLLYPGDPMAPEESVRRCRCVAGHRILPS